MSDDYGQALAAAFGKIGAAGHKVPLRDSDGREIGTATVSADGTMTGDITDPEAARMVRGADGVRYVSLETIVEGDIIHDMVGPGHVISRRGGPDELRELTIEALRPLAAQLVEHFPKPRPAPPGVNERAWELTRPRRGMATWAS